MAKHIFKTGKKARPKTAVKGKRFRCAKCRKRSPQPVKTPAPWYCPNCLNLGSTSESGGKRIMSEPEFIDPSQLRPGPIRTAERE